MAKRLPPYANETFTIELTGQQIDGLRELAGCWGENLEEALRRIAVRGIDLELHMTLRAEADER